MIRFACIACLLVSPVASMAQTIAVKDAQGAVVGFYTGAGDAGTGNEAGYVRVVSNTGYATAINGHSGKISRDIAGVTPDGRNLNTVIRFTTTDCTGQAFVDTSASAVEFPERNNAPLPGAVFRASGGDLDFDLWYVPKGATLVAAGSTPPLIRARVGTTCTDVYGPVNAQYLLYPVTPNDPAVTGFPNVPFVPPLTIEPVPVSAVFSIFRDSFESPQASMALDQNAGGWLAGSRFS